MASILANPRQKRKPMAPVCLQLSHESDSMASSNNWSQKAPPFGLEPICLGFKAEIKWGK